MWLAVGAAILAMVIFLGRQVRLGKVQSGPWFKQFRTLRSVTSLGLMVLGVALMVRGAVWPGLAALAAAVVISSTVRFSGRLGTQRQAPEPAAIYNAEEIKAYETLGLSIGAGHRAIIEAWKRRMKTAHPDQGGSPEQAKMLNAARDLLLKRR